MRLNVGRTYNIFSISIFENLLLYQKYLVYMLSALISTYFKRNLLIENCQDTICIHLYSPVAVFDRFAVLIEKAMQLTLCETRLYN